MRLTDYAHLGTLSPWRLLAPLLGVLLLALAIRAVQKGQLRYRLPLLVLLWVLMIRVALFGNPAAWFGYARTLDANAVGWRQSNVIADELRGYFKPNDGIEYLAIGSSQTGAIFGGYAREHHSLYKYELAGMGPAEYFLYRRQVAALKPQTVLLYLSEFDLGRSPAYSAFRYAPLQGPGFIGFAKLLVSHDGEKAWSGIREVIIGNLLPEFRYGFVMKGLVARWIDRPVVTDPATERFDARDLDTRLSDGPIPLSVAALDRFLEYCQAKGIRVVIVEGSYRPDGYSDANLKLREITLDALRSLTSRHPNAWLLPASELPALGITDYQDGYHVTEETGRRYASAIVARVEAHQGKPR